MGGCGRLFQTIAEIDHGIGRSLRRAPPKTLNTGVEPYPHRLFMADLLRVTDGRTDPELADRTYIEPVTPEWVAKVIERERPDAMLPTVGGQTALNLAVTLAEDGTLALIVLSLVHAAAAIYHHLFQHDATLARMLPRNWVRIPDHHQETSDV